MSTKQNHINQNININNNENVSVHCNSRKTSNTWILSYLPENFLSVIYLRLTDFWFNVRRKPYFKKYVFLMTTSVMILILFIIIFRLFGRSNENENERESLKDIKSCLEDVTVTYENTRSIDIHKNCSNKNGPIKPKTKIRFVMGTSQFFYCIIQGIPNCDDHFIKETEVHINDYDLKDIYFNYVIRDKPKFYIYEGRSLSCNFDEDLLTENHESMIIIGIPQCNSHGIVKQFNKNQFNEFLKNFLNCFETSGLLTDNYKIEFHESCKNFMFSKKTLTSYDNKILFVDDDKIMNVDYYFTRSASTTPSDGN